MLDSFSSILIIYIMFIFSTTDIFIPIHSTSFTNASSTTFCTPSMPYSTATHHIDIKIGWCVPLQENLKAVSFEFQLFQSLKKALRIIRVLDILWPSWFYVFLGWAVITQKNFFYLTLFFRFIFPRTFEAHWSMKITVMGGVSMLIFFTSASTEATLVSAT